MNKTLLILSTHFIDKAIIFEYKKMRDTPNVDAILAIDNTAYKYDFTERIENKIFYGVSVKCFFFDSKLHDEMELPYFALKSTGKFGRVMWYNCDYRFYYVRKYFPGYDYYWQIEYDVFCNAPTYEGFLKKFTDSCADLLIQKFRTAKKNDKKWGWTIGTDWIYNDDTPFYESFFPVVRLSARAIDFLYRRRLEHAKNYSNAGGKNKWIHCELFTATELMNNSFFCETINETNVKVAPNFYFNDNRIFLTPNNKLYHPVKSVKKEISKLQDQIDNLNLNLRKLFLRTLAKSLSNLETPYYINPDFNYLAVPIVRSGGGGQTLIYYIAEILPHSIYIGVHFHENFSDVNVEEFMSLPNLLGFSAIKKENQLSIFTLMPEEMDDVARVSFMMKNLIEATFPIIKKILS